MNILIVSMSTWGELGNWLSGATLAEAIGRDLPRANVTQLKAEGVFPLFGKIGEQIKNATIEDSNPEKRFENYSNVLKSYENYFQSFDTTPVNSDLDRVMEVITKMKPDLIIGTKGVICKVVLSALKKLQLQIPVINYVTNHGHFKFKLHHCIDAKLHLVRFDESREFLIRCTAFKASDIVPVGYLLRTMKEDLNVIGALEQTDKREEFSVVIMSNRGGTDYLHILEFILKNYPEVNVLFLAIKDAELCNAAEKIAQQNHSSNCEVKQELTHGDFLKLMASYRKKGPALFISKASPNAVFEAVYFNMPLVLIRSGLPMEEWAVDKVVEEALGTVDDCVSDVISRLRTIMDNPSSIDNMIKNQRNFSDRYLDQDLIRKNIVQAISSIGR